MAGLFGPKLTDKEVAEGAPVREAFRKELVDLQAQLSSSADTFTETPMQKDAKKLFEYVEKELAWVNANIEVSKRIIEKRSTEFKETYQTKTKEFTKLIEQNFMELKGDVQDKILIYLKKNQKLADKLRDLLQGKLNLKAEEDLKEQTRKINRGYTEIAKDAATQTMETIGKVIGSIVLFILALRSASFAVNDNLWKPLPYRILLFIYVILLFPVTIPYYIYREIRGMFSDDPDMKPHMEGMFPIDPYPAPMPGVEISIFNRFFGYPDTQELRDWILMKRSDYQDAREDALKSTVLQKLRGEPTD